VYDWRQFELDLAAVFLSHDANGWLRVKNVKVEDSAKSLGRFTALWDRSIDNVAETLGQPLSVRAVIDAPAGFEDSTEYAFVLTLWPHLFWSVNHCEKAGCWGMSFRSSLPISKERFDPAWVREGVWTLSDIESNADASTMTEGWEEMKVMELVFGEEKYRGRFVFDLLTEWSKAGK